MEVAAPPAAVLGDMVMGPPDPHRGRRHIIRVFLRRHRGGIRALPVCPKPGKRDSPKDMESGEEEGGEGLGRQMVDGNVGGTGTSQHINRHPRG